ncbi:MAG: hypothetical protein WCO48_01055 [Candidatus Taylorbacteria bacterium]
MNIITQKTDRKESGYTLLFAVLIATLVLGVATFILGIARKQYILSSTARDSLYSFYAADSGIECIAKDSGENSLFFNNTPFDINCAGQTRHIVFSDLSSSNISSSAITFGFSENGTPFNGPIWGCVIVSIDQLYDPNTGNLKQTTIKSKGYNLCDKVDPNSQSSDFKPQSSSRTVERALEWVVRS